DRDLDLGDLTAYGHALEDLGLRTEQSIQRALEGFRLLFQRHPAHVPSMLGIADCLTLLGHGGFPIFRPRDLLPEARAAIHRALEIGGAPDLMAHAHAA